MKGKKKRFIHSQKIKTTVNVSNREKQFTSSIKHQTFSIKPNEINQPMNDEQFENGNHNSDASLWSSVHGNQALTFNSLKSIVFVSN